MKLNWHVMSWHEVELIIKSQITLHISLNKGIIRELFPVHRKKKFHSVFIQSLTIVFSGTSYASISKKGQRPTGERSKRTGAIVQQKKPKWMHISILLKNLIDFQWDFTQVSELSSCFCLCCCDRLMLPHLNHKIHKKKIK